MDSDLSTAMPGPSLTLSPKLSINAEFDGLRIPLDANWKSADGRLYQIANETPQDAVFVLESVNLDYQQVDDVMILAKYVILGNPDKYLAPESVYNQNKDYFEKILF